MNWVPVSEPGIFGLGTKIQFSNSRWKILGHRDLIQKLQDKTLPVGRVLAEGGPTSEPKIRYKN